MRFTKVIIHNYKGISHLELDFSPNDLMVTTLVGLNESGKTTILDAINFIQHDIAEGRRHELIPKSKKGNFSDDISVTTTLSLDQTDKDKIMGELKKQGYIMKNDINFITLSKKYTFQNSKFVGKTTTNDIKIIAHKKGSRKIASLDLIDPQLLDHIVFYIYEELVPKIIYYPNFSLGVPAKILLDINPEPDAFEDNLPFHVRVLQDVLDSIGDNLYIGTHILERILNPSDENNESIAAIMHQMEAKMTEVVFKNWAHLMGHAQKEIILKYGKETDDKNESQAYIEIKLKDGAQEFTIGERSLGFRWFFSFLLFIEFRHNRNLDKGKLLFLLDEPASNLHSTAQTKLLDILQGLIQDNQLVYTTHSHHLINPMWLEGTYIVKNTLSSKNTMSFNVASTDIEAIKYKHFLQKYSKQVEYFQPVLDALDYKPGLLEKIPNILIVEGKSDFYILKYVKEVLLKNHVEINLYPGGGAGKNSQVICLYIAWNKKFLVLMDGDNAGKLAKNEYIKKIGPLVEKRIFTYRDVDTSWNNHSIEDFFDDSEKDQIISTYLGKRQKYSKAAFSRAVQYFLIQGKTIAVSDQTKDRFKKLFKFLEEAMYRNS